MQTPGMHNTPTPPYHPRIDPLDNDEDPDTSIIDLRCCQSAPHGPSASTLPYQPSPYDVPLPPEEKGPERAEDEDEDRGTRDQAEDQNAEKPPDWNMRGTPSTRTPVPNRQRSRSSRPSPKRMTTDLELIRKTFGGPSFPPLTPPSTFQPPDISTLQPPDLSTLRPPDLSTPQPPDLSTLQPPNLSTLQPPAH